jgi:SAM-dependent methyltransferase
MDLNNLTSSEIVKLYNADKSREIEIRMNIANPNIFADLFGHFVIKKLPVFEQSITAITDRDITESKNNMIDTDRNIITFKNGEKENDIYIKKKRLGATQFKSRNLGIFNMVLSEEREIEKFSNNGAKTINIRVRASFVRKNWQYDFNIVKELQISYISQLPTYKKLMLKDFDVDSFLKLIDTSGLKFSMEMEYKNNADLTEEIINKAINDVVCIIDPDHKKTVELQDAIHTASRYIRPRDESNFRSRFGFKQLLVQAKTVTKSIYRDEIFPHLGDFYISPKADGERCLVLVTNNSCQLITANNIMTVNIGSEEEGISVIDCELMMIGGKPKVIPIDVICLNNENIRTQGFEMRYDAFEKAKELLEPILGPGKPFKRLKLENYKSILQKLIEKEWSYKVDGIIFVRAGDQYTDTRIYKWKANPTIDFLVRKVPVGLHGIAPYQKKEGYEPYILCCGINHQRFRESKLTFVQGFNELFPHNSRRGTYFPIQFSPADFPRAYIYYHPSDENLDGKVVEFSYIIPTNESVINGTWKVEKIRDDRKIELQYGNYYGNDYDVALTNWNNLSNPVTFDFLCNPTTTYFKEPKSDIHIPMTKCTGYIKGTLIAQLRGANWVIDLCSGQGSDIFNYSNNSITNILFIDKDLNALQELQSRIRSKRIDYRAMTHLEDLCNSVETITKNLLEFQIPTSGVDGVVCNFGIHYLVESDDAIVNTVKLISKLIKPGGRFIFTLLDGIRVHDKFLKHDILKDKAYDFEQDGVVKYSIKRKYRVDKFSKYKCKIGIKLPFSAGNYYDEILVNVEYLIDQFEKNGFEREQYAPFTKLLPNFEKHNKQYYDMLDTADLEFLKLYSYVTLYKPQLKTMRTKKAL